jgi:peptidyl-prolyl cis-trans isomerase C
MSEGVATAEPGTQLKPVTGNRSVSFPDPVARVNGVALSAAELKKALATFEKSPASAQVPSVEKAGLPNVFLQQMIDGELIYQIAQNTRVANEEQQLDAAMAQVKARFGNDAEFKRGMQQQGLTESELRDLLRRNLIVENFVETQVVPGQQVTDAEIKEFYDKNPETFTGPEQVRASHILIKVDASASAADKQKARAEAESLLRQIRSGADFAKLAQENSDCPSGNQGGDLGYFGRGQMVKPFEEKAFSMQPGDVSGVVETQFGYHIIKLNEKRAAGKVPLDEVKGKLAASLQQRKVSQAVNSLVSEARKKAKIEIFLK